MKSIPLKTATRCELTRPDGTSVTLTCSWGQAMFLRRIFNMLGFDEIGYRRIS